MDRDTIIFNLINKEDNRQIKGIELIASENFVSNQVMEATGSCLTNKYAEGYPGKRYYGGCQFIDEIEQLAIERAKRLFNATWVNVQPHSGAQANAAVMLALLKPGDVFMGLDLSHGGHLTHGSFVNYSGILYSPLAYEVHKDSGLIDYDMMEKLALKKKPKLIIAGASAYSRDWDYRRMREIADISGALLMADIAHPAGFIATGILNNPFPHCHVVTSTTHKTLRGPRGGIIMMDRDFENPWGLKTPGGSVKMISQILDSAVFPGIQGGPLEHIIAAKAVAFEEALSDSYRQYMLQVKRNAAVMSEAFMRKGYNVVSGGTDNHSMLIDLRTNVPDISGKQVENALVKADITINKNMVPFDDRSPFKTSGIRIGTPAITTRGMSGVDMEEIVEFIDEIIMNIHDDKTIAGVREKINTRMINLPRFAW